MSTAKPRTKAAPFDAENHVWLYRFAYDRGDVARTDQLRAEWKAWQGDDCLHASAFGEPIERDAYEDRWKRNEAELNRLYGMSPLSRETYGARIDELEAEQDSIEFELGKEGNVPARSRRWSGMP